MRVRSNQIKDEQGFTLIELLVTVSIMAILFGLLMPAVQSAREAARRTQCANNLRQLGIALNQYESAHGRYPYLNVGFAGPAGHYTGYGVFSVHSSLLPFLDQQPLYASLNFHVPSVSDVLMGLGGATTSPHPANDTAARFSLATFLCASDPEGSIGTWAGTNYRANLGTAADAASRALGPPVEGENGAFVILQSLSPSAFRDGTSSTVAFSEKPRGRPSSRYEPYVGYWVSDVLYTSHSELVALCRSLRGQPSTFQNDVGNIWLQPFQRFTFYKHDVPPNGAVPDCVGGWNNSDPAFFNGNFVSRSYHPGGVNSVCADGHVSFARSGMATAVWRAIGTRAGGEAISPVE